MSSHASHQTANRPRWLLIDDDPELLQVLRLSLERLARAEICCCRNGVEAWNVFAAAPETFEVILVDFHLPPKNGFVLATRMRTLAPKAKLILMTGDTQHISPEMARELGFNGMLGKPFTIDDVLNVIASANTDTPKRSAR